MESFQKDMIKKGIEVAVICYADQKPIQEGGIKVYPVIENWNLKGVQSVLKVIKNIQPDWFIAQYVPHGFQPKGLPFASLLLYRTLTKIKVPILTIFHEIKIRPEHAVKTKVLSTLQAQIANYLSKKSDKIVTSIDFYKDYLKKFEHKITVIPIASNILPTAVPDELKRKLRLKYNIGTNTKVICTFGNRNILSYIDAFDKLASKFPDFIWLICGKNSTPSDILESRNYIKYAGKMPSEQIYQHLSIGDIFFMPDDINAEGEGGTSNKSGSLACAFSLGIPIVGTKGDLNNNLLIDKKNIILTDIRNTESLYQSLKSCLDSATLCSNLGSNALELYENELRWEVVTEKILSRFQVSGVRFQESGKKLTSNT